MASLGQDNKAQQKSLDMHCIDETF